MQDHIIDVSRDWPSLLFTGLGITFSLVAYVGGMFLARAAP